MNKWTDPIKESKVSNATAWGKNREIARKLLMKAKLYRASALFFAITGILLFIQMFVTKIQGHFLDAMRDPFTILIILIPFLPAIVLSIMAQKAEREFAALKPFEKSGDKSADPTPQKPAKK